MTISFHPAARRELRKYQRWYLQRSEPAAAGFEREIDQAISRILEAPHRYPLTVRGRRRFVLVKYPFDVIYRLRDDDIQIVAIAHHSRRPEYWARR
jgi:plasmid stabilization system protein ParE